MPVRKFLFCRKKVPLSLHKSSAFVSFLPLGILSINKLRLSYNIYNDITLKIKKERFEKFFLFFFQAVAFIGPKKMQNIGNFFRFFMNNCQTCLFHVHTRMRIVIRYARTYARGEKLSRKVPLSLHFSGEKFRFFCIF